MALSLYARTHFLSPLTRRIKVPLHRIQGLETTSIHHDDCRLVVRGVGLCQTNKRPGYSTDQLLALLIRSGIEMLALNDHYNLIRPEAVTEIRSSFRWSIIEFEGGARMRSHRPAAELRSLVNKELGQRSGRQTQRSEPKGSTATPAYGD